MMTVIDPLGTPSVVFNGDGTSIINLTGGVSTTTIPAPGSQTTVVVAAGSASEIFQMSSDFNIGDVVELYRIPSNEMTLNDENGNAIAQVSGGSNNSIIARKVASAGSGRNWMCIQGAGAE